MGRLVMLKCDCGYEYDRYHYGVNTGYEEVRKHQTALVRSGKYGKKWKELLASDPELRVDAEILLYQCPRCHKIYDEYAIDLYRSEKGSRSRYYTPEPDEVIYNYTHLCPDCKKRMEKIWLERSEYTTILDEKEEPVICPKCGDVAIAKLCGWTD